MTQFLSVDDQQMESPLYGGHFSAVRVLSSRTRRIVRLWLGYCIAMLNRRHSQAAPFAWRTRIDPAIRTKCSFSPFLRKQIAMSQFNPYEPTQSRIGADPNSPRQVSINPIDLYKRSLALMGDQYWLFVGMTFLAMLIGSVVPFGILMGPMFVGLYLCFKEREEGRRVEFGKLFQGFDEFVNSLIVTLILIVVSLGGHHSRLYHCFRWNVRNSRRRTRERTPASKSHCDFWFYLCDVYCCFHRFDGDLRPVYVCIPTRSRSKGWRWASFFDESQGFAQKPYWCIDLHLVYNDCLDGSRYALLPTCLPCHANQLRCFVDSLPRCFWSSNTRIVVWLPSIDEEMDSIGRTFFVRLFCRSW
jgi:hypothetical protein